MEWSIKNFLGQVQNPYLNEDGRSRIVDEYLDIMRRLNRACDPILKNIQDNGTSDELIKFRRDPKGDYEAEKQTVRIEEIKNTARTDWKKHETYILYLMPCKVSVLFLGMNPSRFSGSGLPFANRDAFLDFWKVEPPENGYNDIIKYFAGDGNGCISGRRFWKFIKEFFENKFDYTDHCFAMNCSPLTITGYVEPSKSVFGNVPLDNFEDNETPPSLRKLMDESKTSLAEAINKMKPMLIVGFGKYAFNIARKITKDQNITCEYAPHPAWPKFKTDKAWIESLKEGPLAVKIRETISKA